MQTLQDLPLQFLRQERKHHDQLEVIRLHNENKELTETVRDCRFRMSCAIRKSKENR